jgi:hypothetical protein
MYKQDNMIKRSTKINMINIEREMLGTLSFEHYLIDWLNFTWDQLKNGNHFKFSGIFMNFNRSK